MINNIIFPVKIFGLYPHLVFNLLSFFINLFIYKKIKEKRTIPKADEFFFICVTSATFICGIAGSIILHWFESPKLFLQNYDKLSFYFSGTTIVGGLLGGLIGVELVKKHFNYKKSTGDDLVYPILSAMIIGRTGCFLSGLSDNTYGTETSLPWGVNFGDGIFRHPTQIYEQIFLLILLFVIINVKRKKIGWDGINFQIFMVGYLVYRFFSEFIKPITKPYLGLDNIQVACILALIYYFAIISKKIVGGKVYATKL